MKTHREHLTENLYGYSGPVASDAPVTNHELLLFADMLDEREADKEQCSATDSWADGTTFRCTKKANNAYPHNFGTTEQDYADQFRDATEKVEPTNEVQAFPDELIARLRLVRQKAIRESLERGGECHPDVALRAVLSELAKALVEMPSESDVLDAWFDGNRPSIPSWHRERSAVVASMIRARIAPVLAAKDARIAEQAKRIAELEKRLDDKTRDWMNVATKYDNEREPHRRTMGDLGAAKDKIEKDAEEKQATAHAYIVSLEKRIAELATVSEGESKAPGQSTRDAVRLFTGTLHEYAPDWHSLAFTSQDDWSRAEQAIVVPYSKRIAELEKDARIAATQKELLLVSIEELKKRIAELTTPVIVDGKTPGQIDYEAYGAARWTSLPSFTPWNSLDDKTKAHNEAGAQAVLRAFGGEALRQVRTVALSCDFPEIMRVLDTEIARIGHSRAAELAKSDRPFPSQSVLDTLRERFTYMPEPGDGDGAKWILRSDILNAIDEFSTPRS